MQNSEAKIWKSAAGGAKQSDQRRSFQPWLNCRTVGLAQRWFFFCGSRIFAPFFPEKIL
jgi:hypothetical protein